MTRERSNSITHLVKIVAREEMNEPLIELEERINYKLAELGSKIRGLESEVKTCAEKFPPSEIKRVGDSWSDWEENTLLKEYHDFIRRASAHHGRNQAGITSRLKKLGILR